jgi:predicted AAA+ superfamily ATPase
VATNPSAALVKAPKLLWSDCGLAAWLAGIKSSADAAQRLDAGFWLEQTLFQTLDTWRDLDSQRRKLHFWRDRAGHEADFILEEAGKLVALEIKAGSQVTTSDLIGIRELAQPEYVKSGVVLEDLDMFDAEFFGFSPKDASIMDPQHRIFLERAWEALEDAGHAPKSFEGSIGVYAG